MLHLKQAPDFVLAADVVYGTDMKQRRALVKTIKAVSGSYTLVIIANVHRYPLNHPKARRKDGDFYKALSDEFDIELLPQAALHPDFRRHGAGSCLIHVLRRSQRKKASTEVGQKKRNRQEPQLQATQVKRQGKVAMLVAVAAAAEEQDIAAAQNVKLRQARKAAALAVEADNS
eukprot:gnl/MRDRNA2_/MRDRNA2_76638_c0_seq1.p1 gnl/MRDRNA2_/MRDRNA2_76638_c0~~gnl/MRDRNA2_/MRDRNA2_76638_c0_seq1.p1  ORF type:complete len:174 (+),score=47.23 gnl/MRDRNA2_/MRDRNA2_76638_c0_seq1:555-1076(+)